MKEYRVIGLMSGTSLDGIDAALIRTDGEGHIVREAFLCVPYDPALREKIRACLNAPERAADVERALTEAHAEAVLRLLKENNLKPENIDLIGFHGQTIGHDPSKGYTCQMGDGALLTKLTGIQVVNDFRTADVKAGGQGAPLVPVYHQALAEAMEKPVAFLNIGGIANVTYIGANGDVIAFDTGPGNALLDDWMLKHAGMKYDDGGKTASSGVVHGDIVSAFLQHSYFETLPPKSLDRNDFTIEKSKGLSLEDGAATLASLTVEAVVYALEHLPEAPKKWVVSGGGRLNAFFMNELEKKLQVPVVSIDDFGLNGDAIEAEAFAYLAVRSMKGLPISFPKTTGVPRPMTGGKLHCK